MHFVLLLMEAEQIQQPEHTPLVRFFSWRWLKETCLLLWHLLRSQICVLASCVKKCFSFHMQKDPQSILDGHLAEATDQPEPNEGLKA